jgi:hypothetical protein
MFLLPVTCRRDPSTDLLTCEEQQPGERRRGRERGDHFYPPSTSKLWNALPINIRELATITKFKRHLKTYYFKQHYK